jgi:transcription-repair coupling factor (superfamily II helicase)
MLEEALAKMRSGEIDAPDDDGQWSPQINLGVPVLLPEAYIADLDVRLGLYRRLSSLATREELEGFAAELHDRFGKPPPEVESLLGIMRVKAMCRRAGIAKLDGGPKGATVQFRNDKFANPAGLALWMAGQNNLAKVKGTKLVIRRNWDDDDVRVKGAFDICRALAEVAEAEKAPA